MARTKVKLNSRGVVALLNAPGVGDELAGRLARASAVARSISPRSDNDGPHYADAFIVTRQKRKDRTVAQLGNTSDYAMSVEAAHGVLARALGSVR